MAWDLDPDLTLQPRLSFGRRTALLASLITAGLLLALALTGAPGDWMLAWVAAASLAMLVIALPFASIHVAALDRDGRLDQHRLSGRSEAHLLFVLIGGTAWILILLGLPSFFLAASLQMTALHVLAMVAVAAALSNLVLAVRTLSQADSVVLVVLSMHFCGIALIVALKIPAAPILMVVAGAGIWLGTLPIVTGRIRRPAHTGHRHRAGILRKFVTLRSARFPEFWRAILTSPYTIGVGGIALLLAALMTWALGIKDPYVRRQTATSLVYVPLIVAALDASIRARRELTSLSLERVWLTAQGRWSVFLQLAAAYAVPFLCMSLVAAVPLMVLHPGDAIVLRWLPAAAAILVSLGLAEGFHGRRIGLYVMPFAVAAERAFGNDHGRIAWVMALILWLPTLMAVESLEHPDGPPVPGPLVVPAAVSMSAAMTCLLFQQGQWFLFGSMPLIAAMMSLATGLFVPDRVPLHAPWLLMAAAVGSGLASGLTLYLSLDKGTHEFVANELRYAMLLWPATYAILIGALAGAGLTYGWFAHNRFGSTRPASWLVRGLPLVAWIGSTLIADSVRWPGSLAEMVMDQGPRRLAIDASLLALLVIASACLALAPNRSRHATQP